MILTKDELLASLLNEIRVLMHLASKVDPDKLDYRPTPEQRSTLELLHYLVIFSSIHLRAILSDRFDMNAWRQAWTTSKAAVQSMSLDQAREAISKLSAEFSELLGSSTEAELTAQFEMFGYKASRAALIMTMVLCHFSAYRMQLFLYLKASGRPELNTLNLWAGVDQR